VGRSRDCHAWPNVSPKRAYVAFATLTQVLDGASFSRFVPVDSTSVYAAEFRKKDRSYVTCLWTVRGTRPVTLRIRGARQVAVADLMGRASAVAVNRQEVTVEISNRPCYVATSRPISSITLGVPVHETRPAGQSFVVSALDQLADWTVESASSAELEMYNFLNPRRPGTFEYREVAGPEAGRTVLEVTPKLPADGSKYLPMYSVLALNEPVELPRQPTQIAVLVNGNGGWGRLIFELEDAAGQRWISIGAEQRGAPMEWMKNWLNPEAFSKLNSKLMNVSDWNSDDAWGRSYINFDGWRLVKFPLPGQYPGEGYHWPMNSQWRFSGDGVVRYPALTHGKR